MRPRDTYPFLVRTPGWSSVSLLFAEPFQVFIPGLLRQEVLFCVCTPSCFHLNLL